MKKYRLNELSIDVQEYVLSQLMLGNQGKGERLYIEEVKE